MGVFKKKADPISERAKALNKQIEALETEIRQLSTHPTPAPEVERIPGAPKMASAKAPLPEKPSTPASQPRLRSTTLPRSATGGANPFNTITAAGPAAREAVVDVADQGPLQQERAPETAEHFNDLGVRKYNLQAAWNRFKSNFRGPMASNPKLVNYLAAGSIQGLRPLRYEKRVARNRFLVFVAVLIVVLWGLIWLFVAKH